MEQQILITMSPGDLLSLVKQGIREVEKEKEMEETQNTSYSIAKAAKELGRHHSTLKKMILEGKIETIDGGRRIPLKALNRYLQTE